VQLIKFTTQGEVEGILIYAGELIFREVLKGLGLEQCRNDPALFILKVNNIIKGAIHVYVDDILGAGDSVFEASVQKLETRLKFGARQWGDFVHLGLHILQSEDLLTITIDQADYIRHLSGREE
jgi:hypothetical protein